MPGQIDGLEVAPLEERVDQRFRQGRRQTAGLYLIDPDSRLIPGRLQGALDEDVRPERADAKASFRLGGETAIGSLAADAVLVPVLARTDGRRGVMAAAGVVTAMLAKRLAGNAPVPAEARARTYLNRLVFDRDSAQKEVGAG